MIAYIPIELLSSVRFICHLLSKTMFLHLKSVLFNTYYCPISIENAYDLLEFIWFDFTFWGESEEIKINAMTFLLSLLQDDKHFEAYVTEQMQKSSLNKLCWHPVYYNHLKLSH